MHKQAVGVICKFQHVKDDSWHVSDIHVHTTSINKNIDEKKEKYASIVTYLWYDKHE